MRRLLTALLATGLAVAGTAGSAVAAPTRTIFDEVALDCAALTGSGGTAQLQVLTGPDAGAFATVWRPGDDPLTDLPWLGNDDQDMGTASADGSAVTAGIRLVELETGQPAGTATVDAVVTASGTPTVERSRDAFGNAHGRATITTTPAEARGSLTVPGAGVFQLEDCVTTLRHVEWFMAAPAAFIDNGPTTFALECSFDAEGTAISFSVEGMNRGDRGQVGVSLWEVPEGSDDPVTAGGGLVAVTRTTLSGTIALVDPYTEAPAGEAGVQARLTVIDRDDVRLNEAPTTLRQRTETLGVDGELTMPDGRSFDLRTCVASREQSQLRIHPSR